MRPQSRDDLPAVEPMRRHINRIDATEYEKDSRRSKPRNKRAWRGRGRLAE